MANETTNQGRWRKFYPAMLDGYRISHCSESTQLFFWRIQFLADDFGNFKCNPAVLCALAYPEGQDKNPKTPADIARMLEELKSTRNKEGNIAPLIDTYVSRGDVFVHIMEYPWRQSPPNGKGTHREGVPASPHDQREAKKSNWFQSIQSDRVDNKNKKKNKREDNNSKSKEGAAAVAGVILSEQEEADAKALTKRPEWLREGLGWFDLRAAREIIALRMPAASVMAAIRAAKASRATLTNPAGWIRSELTTAANELKRAGGAA